MIESAIISALRNDGEITSALSTYDGHAAVFSDIAPEDAEYPYVVISVSQYAIADLVIDGFDVFIHYFERGESRAKARSVAERVEFIFDPNTFQTDRYSDIRFYRNDGSFLDESDPIEIHYVKQFTARGTRKKWINQL